MLLEPFGEYFSQVHWDYCSTCYWAPIRPPMKILFHAQDVHSLAWKNVLEILYWLQIRINY